MALEDEDAEVASRVQRIDDGDGVDGVYLALQVGEGQVEIDQTEIDDEDRCHVGELG